MLYIVAIMVKKIVRKPTLFVAIFKKNRYICIVFQQQLKDGVSHPQMVILK